MKFRSSSRNSAPVTGQEGNFADGVTVKWLQSAGLQHLASSSLDQQQLFHDILLHSYGGNDIPRNESFEYNTAQWNTLNSSGESFTNVSVKIENGLLDLKSTQDDTNFLCEDLTSESFDLLPNSPPKVVNRGFSSIVRGKFPIKSNNITKPAIDQKKSEKTTRKKEVHKERVNKMPVDLSASNSPDSLKTTDSVLAFERTMKMHAKHEDTAVPRDTDVVALQFASPEWSPTRGLCNESSLIQSTECKRSTGKHDDDFSFLRDEESINNSERTKKTVCKMENISKKMSLMIDCSITTDKNIPVSNTKELDNKLNSSKEDLNKFHSPSGAILSEDNNAAQTKDKGVIVEIVNSPVTSTPSEINKRLNSAIEDLAKSHSTRKVRSTSVQRKEVSSKESYPSRVRVLETEREELDMSQFSFHHSSNYNALNSEIEEKPTRTLKGNNPHKSKTIAINKELHDLTDISSPRKSENRIRASSVRRKETPKELNSDKIRVVREESRSVRNKTPSKKEMVVTNKSKEHNSKRVSTDTDQMETNPKDNGINNTEPVKRENEKNHNPVSISREEVTSTRGTDAISMEKNAAKIRVVVRKRPLNKKEKLKKEKDILFVEDGERLIIHEPKVKVDLTSYIEKHEFHFDAVLHDQVTNDEVYNATVGPSIPTILEQTRLTCFTFGHTGSGKTFTMGNLLLRASKDILQLLQNTSQPTRNLTLWISYFEICGKTIFDLLNARRKLCTREDGNQQVCIIGLQEYEISDIGAVEKLISKGNAARSKGSTVANEESSRSHSVLQLAIKQNPLFTANGTRRKGVIGELKAKGGKVIAKISFIDLAGNERGADRVHNDHDDRKGVEINKSLLALKECIRALDNDQNHVPFRGSKLTEVLRDSFIGDARTVMICCVSPSAASCEQTLNSLRYAERVKNLCKDGAYSQNDQGISDNLIDPEKTDQHVEKITTEVENDRDVYNPEPELVENLPMRDVYHCIPEIGESSFRFMPICGFIGSEDIEPNVENQIQNNVTNRCSTSYVSSFDFGTGNLQQIYDNEEQIVQPTEQAVLSKEKGIQAVTKEGSNHSSTFNRRKDYSNDNEIVETISSFYQSNENWKGQNSIMMHNVPSNSLNIHQEEFVKIEHLTEEICEKENHFSLECSGLHSYQNYEKEEISRNHQDQQEFSTDSDIKTIFEVYSSRISDIDKVEKAVEQTREKKKLMDASHIARAKSIEKELFLPLDVESKDLQVISGIPITISSDFSTQNPSSVSESTKTPKKSPKRRILRGEENNENGNILSKEESISVSENHKKEFFSGVRVSKGQATGRKEIGLFEEGEALLAAHRKVIQNTMNILGEEMNLLVQIDQPGSLINRYVAELSSVVSRKAADLVSLQEHVIRIQRLQDRRLEQDSC